MKRRLRDYVWDDLAPVFDAGGKCLLGVLVLTFLFRIFTKFNLLGAILYSIIGILIVFAVIVFLIALYSISKYYKD